MNKRQRNKSRRDSEKKNRRENNRLRYASMVGTSANKKKKRGLIRQTNTQAVHKGFPHEHNPIFAPATSCLKSKMWSSSKWRGWIKQSMKNGM